VKPEIGSAKSFDIDIEFDPLARRTSFQDTEQPDWFEAERSSYGKSVALVDEERQDAQFLGEKNGLRLAFIDVKGMAWIPWGADLQPRRRRRDPGANRRRSFGVGSSSAMRVGRKTSENNRGRSSVPSIRMR
jgi:hypothetical protein